MKPDSSAFLAELKSSFPALIEEINSQQGLFTFEVDVFRRFTQAQIDDGDRRAAKRCFEIAGKYYLHGNDRFRRIIDNCYVECLDFKDSKKRSRNWAWDLFPPGSRTATRTSGAKSAPDKRLQLPAAHRTTWSRSR